MSALETSIVIPEFVDARVAPRGALESLSQQEIEQLLSSGQGGLYPLFRRCALAVLNAGSDTDDAREIFDKYRDFDIRLVRHAFGVKLEIRNAPAAAFVDGEMIRGIKELLFAVLRDVVYIANEIVDSGNFGRLTAMNLETGRAAYSIKALEKLTSYMTTKGVDESAAIDAIYPAPKPTGELSFRLSAPKPTGNIVVDGSLRMIQRAVNGCIDSLGVAPNEVIVELARDLPLGLKRRQEIIDKHDKNAKQRSKAREEIRVHGVEPTDRLVHRYLLWKELEDRCPYCERRLSFEDALDSNRSHVDHIIPR